MGVHKGRPYTCSTAVNDSNALPHPPSQGRPLRLPLCHPMDPLSRQGWRGYGPAPPALPPQSVYPRSGSGV